ncbi:MAG: hypothetical protein KAT93_01710 [Desulfuromonadales bacterium]|nr:hypothetical protein [Desulfuromonadales bacterium]
MNGLCNRRHLSLVLVSAALLAFQIALLQILATSQWHHFAYLVISTALLGFGAAGTILSLGRHWMAARQAQLLPLLLCGCAVTLAGSLGLAQGLFGGFDSFLLFVDIGEVLRLAAVALLLMLPFACGALAIGLIFTVETERISSYYFANMFGSGLGSLLGLAGLSLLRPEQLPPCCGLLALTAAAVLLPGTRRGVRCVVLISLAMVAAFLLQHPELALSQYKDLRRALDLPGARIIAHQPAAAGQVHIVEAPVLRSAAGVSLNWSGKIPKTPAVFINGDMIGSLPLTIGSDNPRDAATFALPYALGSPRRVLVLNAGTGADVAQALDRGADEVVAVEPHKPLVELLRTAAPTNFGRVFTDPRVAWQSIAPRTWLARDRQEYDLIILPSIGGFGGNAGLFALHEQPLLTREALQLAWSKLRPQGLLAVTTWVDYPVRNPLRLLATLVETLQDAGIATPKDRIAAVRSWGTLTFCVKRTPFSTAELAKIRTFAERWAFDPALLPDLHPDERQRYNRLQDDSLFELFEAVFEPGRAQLYRNYAFRIWPVSDDQPFFSQFLRWSRLDMLIGLYGQRTVPFLELGMLVAGLAAVVLSLLATLLILLPLAGLPRGEGRRWKTLLYFGGLGVGYMWTELALIHRFVFYLGQPVYAAALVVAVLLIGSAVGSALTGGFTACRPWRWAAVVAVTLLFYALLLGPLLQTTLSLSLPGRVALAILVLIPAAVVMGMPFPLGLKLLNQVRRAEVPWAWGVNGCLSVVGAAVATIIAVEVGYSLLLLLAAGAYLLPTVIRLRIS